MYGWGPLNRALLDNKEIKGTMTENDKKRNATVIYSEKKQKMKQKIFQCITLVSYLITEK